MRFAAPDYLWLLLGLPVLIGLFVAFSIAAYLFAPSTPAA